MLTLTQRLPANADTVVSFTLALTAEERTKSRHRFETEEGQTVFLRLPRGTVLRDNDILQSQTDGTLVRVRAKPEPVFTVTAQTLLDLLRAAYHLGNRHVPLEIAVTYLRLSPDPVLQKMLEQMGMKLEEAVLPFQPEIGAYGSNHVH
jgi:urease accessory protein